MINYYRITESLRKNILKVDFRVFIGNTTDFKTPQEIISKGNSLIVGAIKKGLDIVGFISDDPKNALIIKQDVISKNYDIHILAGQEIITSENLKIVALNIQNKIANSNDLQTTLKDIKSQRGYSIVVNPPKSILNKLNKIYNNPNEQNPDAIEIFNPLMQGYNDLKTEYFQVVNTGATSADELEKNNIMNLISRAYLESKGLLSQNQGVGYTPSYLQE